MLQFVLCLFLTSATNVTIDDDALVAGIENTLGECSDIIEAVDDFLTIFETQDDTRRRNEKSLSEGVTEKLKTCWAIIDAVNTFRESQTFSTKSWGTIVLHSDELN